MKKHLLLTAVLYSIFCSQSAFSGECTLSWQNQYLDTGNLGPKNYFGDTNFAYAIFSFPPDPTTVYRLKGVFPDARFMSVESSELREIDNFEYLGFRDFDAIQDHEIAADFESTNPFTPGTSLDIQPRNFTLDIVPEGAQWPAFNNNRLDVPTGEHLITIWLRIVLPNDPIAEADLPVIEAYDIDTGHSKTCSQAQVINSSESVAEIENFNLAGAIYAPELFDLSLNSPDLESFGLKMLLQLYRTSVREKWWIFKFQVIDIPFEGNSAIRGYSYGLTRLDPGKIAIVKFKAPTHVETGPDVDQFNPDKDVRYWSLCSLDLVDGQGLACLPDSLAEKDEWGFVTIVYGPEGGAVESKAQALGYNFLPDNREALGVTEQPLALVYRQLLPSDSFSQTGLHKGDYVPRARVCSERMFLLGFCNIR